MAGASPATPECAAQTARRALGALRRPGAGGPGGWWIATEVEVLLRGTEVIRPDVAGWRRERSPTQPTGIPVTLSPDWIGEAVSPTHANDDTVKNLRLYHTAKIAHYWLVDPRDATLTVLRFSDAGYVTRLRVERAEIVRAEPLDVIELFVGAPLGDDPLDDTSRE